MPRPVRVRHTSAELQRSARRLRREMTVAETVLWQALRRKASGGHRFRRQHAAGRFVFDFYCPAHKLVIEVDGEIHEEPEQLARDALRTAEIESFGYRVLRLSNDEVLHHLSAVLDKIQAATDAPEGPLSSRPSHPQ